MFKILLEDKPSESINNNKELFFSLIPELKSCVDFDQRNEWHVFDVWEHILHVVDGVESDKVLRLTALFHDVGKPNTFTVDDNGVGHFYNHWSESQSIFLDFSKKYNLDSELSNLVSKLIFYHDVYVEKASNDVLSDLCSNLSKEELGLLYKIKKSDLLSQNPKYHYLLSSYDEQYNNLINKYYNI